MNDPTMCPSLSTTELTDIFGVSNQRVSKIWDKLKDQATDETFLRGRKRFYNADAVRRLLEHRGFDYKRKIITFTTLKGGTGKTTLTLGTARRLACFGAKVLLVDIDKQANATITTLDKAGDKVLYDVVTGDCSAEDCLVQSEKNLWILPSSLLNSRLETELSNKKVNQLTYYKNLFQPLIDKFEFDYILIDTPPDLSHSVYLAMLASDILVIPVNLDRYAVEGLGMTLHTVNEIRKSYEGINLEVKVVVNKYDAREKTSLEFLTQLQQFDDIDVMPSIVRVDSNFKKSQKTGTPLEFNARSSNAAVDIDAFSRELIGLDDIRNDIDQ